MDNNTVIAEAEEALERANVQYQECNRALWDANRAARRAFHAWVAATAARDAELRRLEHEGVDNTNLSGKV